MICLQILFPGKIYADTEGPKSVRGPWVQDIESGPEINFSGKRLYGCVFIGQSFSDVVFDDCDFTGAQICQCDFRNASFKRANLNGLLLGDSKFEGADFTDTLIGADGDTLESISDQLDAIVLDQRLVLNVYDETIPGQSGVTTVIENVPLGQRTPGPLRIPKRFL